MAFTSRTGQTDHAVPARSATLSAIPSEEGIDFPASAALLTSFSVSRTNRTTDTWEYSADSAIRRECRSRLSTLGRLLKLVLFTWTSSNGWLCFTPTRFAFSKFNPAPGAIAVAVVACSSGCHRK